MSSVLNKRIESEHNMLSLIDFLGGHNDHFPSRKSAKKAIEKGLVHINRSRAKTNYKLKAGDLLEIFPDEQKKKPELDLKIEVLFEDDHLAIINKPAGIQVSGNQRNTLENALSKNLKPSSEEDALPYPEPIHRLDFQTTGIVLIGKTSSAVRMLNKMFEERKIDKEYTAVCIGEMPETGEISSPINGKTAFTSFSVIKSKSSSKYKFLNLVQVRIETGRRHQIRKHMFEMGNPIFGDPEYGFKGLMPKGRGMFLHASGIKFNHPVNGELIRIECKLPNKFGKLF